MDTINIRTSQFYLFIAAMLVFAFFVGAIGFLIAPRLSTAPGSSNNQMDLFATQAAQTLVAVMTQHAVPTSTPTVAPPTIAPTATAEPTETVQPPVTVIPITGADQTPTATATPLPCDWAQLVKDVTIPDGTDLVIGSSFTKTWRLKNIGACTWTKDYALVFSSGDLMGGQKVIALKESVAPGQSVDLSVALVAPGTPKRYTGYWSLRNSAGKVFGLGSQANKAFWVVIDVVQPKTVAYDFVAKACDADWTTKAGVLACPGKKGGYDGFVIPIELTLKQDGTIVTQPALLTEADRLDGQQVRGQYPAFTVAKGDLFKAYIGCMESAPKCNVTFSLQYKIGSDPAVALEYWKGLSRGSYKLVTVDLSALAGKDVSFILKVMGGSSTDDDLPLWLEPRILR